MKDFSASDTLLTALPVILVLLALVGAVIFFPEGSILDIRGRAAPIKATPTLVPLPTAIVTPTPETICSSLYQPVCSIVDNKTYANDCEAGLANALPVRADGCLTATPAILPSY